MIHFDEFVLSNGLRVIIHEDHTIPMAAVDVLYNVGSKNENPDKTGFAHLFEHLMFGGSKNIPVYDEYLQKVGGENNAFTTPDITNYYLTLPAINLETAFWLESDRMIGLSFDPNVLEVQRKVVIEEFKQRYLNQPYGDAWLKMRPLSYRIHPYMWPTIGKDISHIENVTISDVKGFFYNYYRPDNAILAVAGNITRQEVQNLSEKWFGPITPGRKIKKSLPREPRQNKKRMLETRANVPSDAIYMTWHMCGRLDEEYHATDLLSDILGRGKASQLYQKLVKEEKIFNTINAYVTGSNDPGLFIVEGKVNEGISLEAAETSILKIITKLKQGYLKKDELDKSKIQARTSLAFSEVEIVNRAMNLAYFGNLGDPDIYNLEYDKINKVTLNSILETGENILREDNLNVLYYRKEA
jgi:predicted Zn-dependent peptidase